MGTEIDPGSDETGKQPHFPDLVESIGPRLILSGNGSAKAQKGLELHFPFFCQDYSIFKEVKDFEQMNLRAGYFHE
jgi:hypothetical protein